MLLHVKAQEKEERNLSQIVLNLEPSYLLHIYVLPKHGDNFPTVSC